MYGMVQGDGAALVSVQPGTGAVVAYYGGAERLRTRLRRRLQRPGVRRRQLTGEPMDPGSSFKTVTMATALSQGISARTRYWYGPHTEFPTRASRLHNNGATEHARANTLPDVARPQEVD